VAKAAARYVCQSCGASYPRWSGRCDNCGEWNTIVEEVARESAPKGLTGKRGRHIELQPLAGAAPSELRRASAIGEFDRVVGGGLVKGSALLIGGDPGIGKSTLVLQVAAALGRGGAAGGTIYISGEESIEQVRLRARRMGLDQAPVSLAAATSLRDIAATLDAGSPPELVIVDSIQTMYVDNLDSAPGTVAQVRASAAELIRLAKGRGFSLLLVGHVTKEGMIAGPRVLEHMVDTVLYFEGERSHQFRILRAVKNRFGPANEIGVFEMTDAGLVEVSNPSALFLTEHHGEVSGAVVFAGIEGSRPMLVEIQALLAPSPPGTPRRAVVGWDQARLAMVLAVLEARCGLALGGYDVYLNVAGGLRIGEPAADLAVAAALVSSRLDRPVPAGMVAFGEIGLGGEVRAVGQVEQRLKEAEKLGFTDALIPPLGNRRKAPATRLQLHPIDHLSKLVERLARTPKD
jgi:DNA repair protein RadA/Sms